MGPEAINLKSFDILDNSRAKFFIADEQFATSSLLCKEKNKFLEGFKGNPDIFAKLQAYVQKSPVLVTLLNPIIGYLKAAEVYKEALSTDRNIREIVLERELMTAEQFDEAMSKEKLIS